MNPLFESGVAIFRDVFPRDDKLRWLAAIAEYAPTMAARTPAFNPVAVELDDAPEVLREIARHPSLIALMQECLGTIQVALYNERLVVKDAQSRGAVPLHQDSCYHQGFHNKWSAFVALSPSNADNGGLIAYPETHRFGSLGDAGEIDPTLLAGFPASRYLMHPGDVMFMHSHTWHRSDAWYAGPDRILLDVIFQPADDPTGKELLSGYWNGKYFTDKMRTAPHVRSRVSRIKELEAELKRVREVPQTYSCGVTDEDIRLESLKAAK